MTRKGVLVISTIATVVSCTAIASLVFCLPSCWLDVPAMVTGQSSMRPPSVPGAAPSLRPAVFKAVL